MPTRSARVFALFLAAASAASPALCWEDPAAPSARPDAPRSVLAASREWPEKARLLAAAITAEYGAPDETIPAQMVWNNRLPWSRIVVFRDAQSAEHPNNLLQIVAYEVPLRRWRALSAFDRGVTYDPVKRELAARTDSEPTNLLALNLADEVAQGRRTPADANAFFDKTVELSLEGKSSPYTSRLMFSPGRRAPDPTGRDHDLEQEQREILHFEGWR